MKFKKLGLVLVAALVAVAAANAQQAVLKVGYAPFGVPVTFLPGATPTTYATLDPDGSKAQGANVDLLKAVAKDAGLQIQFVAAAVGDYAPTGPAGTQIPLTNGQTVDITLGSGGPAAANAALLDFATPIYNNGDCLLVLKTDTKEYKAWEDLKGEVVGAQKGAAAADAAPKSGLFKEVKVYDVAPDLEKAVSKGEVKAGLCTSAVASSYKFNPTSGAPDDLALGIQVAKSYQMKFPIEAAWAVRKGNTALLSKLNTSLAKLKADGTVKMIFAKYGIEATLVK